MDTTGLDDRAALIASLDRLVAEGGDANLRGLMVRVRESAYYRSPPRGSPSDFVDTNTLRAREFYARNVRVVTVPCGRCGYATFVRPDGTRACVGPCALTPTTPKGSQR